MKNRLDINMLLLSFMFILLLVVLKVSHIHELNMVKEKHEIELIYNDALNYLKNFDTPCE
jgi:hypothetical protein